MFARIRKAVVAGIGAGTAAFLPALLDQLNVSGFTQVSAVNSLFVALSAGLATTAVTYQVRNAGTVNGSEPAAPRY